MPEIRKLPEHIIVKIAAGEVIETPAAVMKELIENSLDAGARSLDLAVERGGLRLIRVVDDGEGIAPDQVRLAFMRHATSKIADLGDLQRIQSFGFRGEALPSIAAVSMLEMITGQAGQEAATRIVIEGGEEKLLEPASPRNGTTVTVRHLFYNLPARRKFLKSEAAEARRITSVVLRYAIASPECAIKLVLDDREVINFPGNNGLAERLIRIWGEKVGRYLIEIEGVPTRQLRIKGFVCRPEVNRPNRNQIYIFVNGRPIYDPSLIHALRAGYGHTLESGLFPLAAIFIEMAPHNVDVNVHPTKNEVRFADERFLYTQLKKIVESAVRVPALFVTPSSQRASEPKGRHSKPSQERTEWVSIRNHPHVIQRTAHAPDKEDGEVPQPAFDLPSQEDRFWQLYDTYIMGFRDGKVWMIDQHTAHERILFEEALDSLYERQGISQRLLFDLMIELEPSELGAVEEHIALFRRAGFELEQFGQQAVLIRGVPAYFQNSNVEKIFRNMLAGFIDGVSTGEEPAMALASALACHAAVKAGDVLSPEQMQSLFNRLFECEDPYRCPHGRPTVASISRDDLEKLFRRR